MKKTEFPAIRNWQYSPPSGGWSVNVEINGFSRFFQGSHPVEILNKVKTFSEQVGYEPEPGEIEAILNAEWISRDPSRGLPTMPPPKPQVPRSRTPSTPRHFPPRDWGRNVWSYLNTFGMVGAFDAAAWGETIRRISKLLNPTVSPLTGCADCFNEWMDILRDTPPEKVSNEILASKWVWSAHNRVNRKLGKKEFSWESAAAQNGWNA